VAKAVDDWENLSDKRMYVVVTVDSILVKRVQKETQSAFINLISINPEYASIRIDRNEIREVWLVNSKLTFDLEADTQQVSLHSLHQEMKELRAEVKKLVKN
jgi:hypothetical protein